MTKPISFTELKPGDQARVLGFAPGQHDYRQRLLAMGITPNTLFKLIRKAPLGDPIHIQVRNFDLTLRAKEADILQLEWVAS